MIFYLDTKYLKLLFIVLYCPLNSIYLPMFANNAITLPIYPCHAKGQNYGRLGGHGDLG